MGTIESWAKKLEELTNSNYLRGYTMYYYSEEQPIAEGNYWHYNKNGEIEIWVYNPVVASEGLKYKLLDNDTYEVSGIGECTDTEIVIPATYEGK